MDEEKLVLMDGRLHVYKRERSSVWQCSTFLGVINHRVSTKEKNLVLAKDFATHWYIERCVAERHRRLGIPLATLSGGTARPSVGTDMPPDRRRRTRTGPTFEEVAKTFYDEYRIATQGERNERYVKQKGDQLRLHLLPFFGNKSVADITAGLIQQYRTHRQTSKVHPETGEPIRPSRSTLHSERVTLRQVLKSANRHGWIAALPDMTVAYKSSGKVGHRAWFSPAEYKLLYEATREHAKNPGKERHRAGWEQLHDYILFMGNTGLRPDEAARLQERDVTIVKDAATDERILEIEVRGKRGTGYCKSMPGAVYPFQRVRQRKNLKPTDLIFDDVSRAMCNTVLKELNLKFDREGKGRTSIRSPRTAARAWR